MGGSFKSCLHTKAVDCFFESHPRQWVDRSSSAYKRRPLTASPNPTHGRSRETKGAELTSQKKRVGRAVVLASIERVVYLPLVSFGPLAHQFDASVFFFTPSFRLSFQTLSVQVCLEFKSWPAPIDLSTAAESIVECCRSHRPR